jgi:hypothetical protein
MRKILVVGGLLFLFCFASTDVTLAQSANPWLQTVSSHRAVGLFSKQTVVLKCPAAQIPTNLSVSRSNPQNLLVDSQTLIDSSGTPVALGTLATLAPIVGGGYSVVIENQEDEGVVEDGEVVITCLDPSVADDKALVLASGSAFVPASSTITVNAFCGADNPVALGGFSNPGPYASYDLGNAPVWGSASSPQNLGDMPDGQAGAPTGWQATLYNLSNAPATMGVLAICGKAATAKTYVSSAPISSTVDFSVFGPLPDGWVAVGAGFAGGVYGAGAHEDIWNDQGLVLDQQQLYPSTIGYNYDSGTAFIRAVLWRVVTSQNPVLPPSASPARAVLAVVAVPQPGTQVSPAIVPVVEFYNAGLDHYFMTANPQEISDLDTGVHKGWTRTGQVFNAYDIGSTGHTGRRPVCRLYGVPSAGLDSHFYSASPDECFTTAVRLVDSWKMEADEVFELDLPDPVSGACPAGDIAVYRVWNDRVDSNHRYTTSQAIRDQMVAAGYIAEGYGPNSVALCALP